MSTIVSPILFFAKAMFRSSLDCQVSDCKSKFFLTCTHRLCPQIFHHLRHQCSTPSLHFSLKSSSRSHCCGSRGWQIIDEHPWAKGMKTHHVVPEVSPGQVGGLLPDHADGPDGLLLSLAVHQPRLKHQTFLIVRPLAVDKRNVRAPGKCVTLDSP